MESRDTIEQILLQFPVCEYAFGQTESIPFSDKVIVICRTDCRRYGHCWACPPHAGNILENMQKVRSYKNYVLFSTVTEVADNMNFDLSMEAKRPHESITREVRRELQHSFPGRFYVLSASRRKEGGKDKTHAVFTASCEADRIDDIIIAIHNAGLELVTIHDRPEGSFLGSYNYIIEAENEAGISDNLLAKIEAIPEVHCLGSFNVLEK